MATPTTPLGNLILQQLKGGEKRILGLVVAVRKSMDKSEGLKGDLSERVKSSINKLVASRVVVDRDGLYSLSK